MVQFISILQTQNLIYKNILFVTEWYNTFKQLPKKASQTCCEGC